jgi:hypothetical protein
MRRKFECVNCPQFASAASAFEVKRINLVPRSDFNVVMEKCDATNNSDSSTFRSASCSTLRDGAASDSSWFINSGEVAAATTGTGGDFVVEIYDHQPKEGVQFLTISSVLSPLDGYADDPSAPIRAEMKQAATVRSVRMPIDEAPSKTDS